MALIQIKGAFRLGMPTDAMWHRIDSIDSVPAQQDLRLAVIDAQGTVHALVFPCRRSDRDWVDARSGRPVDVYPTHWQEWDQP